MHEGWARDMYTKQSFDTEQDGATQMEKPPFGYLT